jgi:hypothetical protein
MVSGDENAVRDAETSRRNIAGWLCAVAAALCVVSLVAIYRNPNPRTALFIETLLACAMAATIVLAARAIDGPITLRSRRRTDAASGGSAGIIVMWLGCFATLAAAFLAIDVIGRAETLMTVAAIGANEHQLCADCEKACVQERARAATASRGAAGVDPLASRTSITKDGSSHTANCSDGRILVTGYTKGGP